MEKVIEFKKPKKRKVLKEDSFVARLPYPLTIHTIVDIVERMGVEHEGTVLPGLKYIERQIVKRKGRVMEKIILLLNICLPNDGMTECVFLQKRISQSANV